MVRDRIKQFKVIFRRGECARAIAARLFLHPARLAVHVLLYDDGRGDDRVVHQLREAYRVRPACSRAHRHAEIAFEKIDAVALGHASDDADHQPRLIFLPIAQLPQPRPDFLLGVFANRARVKENDIRRIAILGPIGIPSAAQPVLAKKPARYRDTFI